LPETGNAARLLRTAVDSAGAGRQELGEREGECSVTAYTFHTYDVFTNRRFAGNPLAIVSGADRLSAEEMQRVAREFNLAETIFVMAPADAANTAKVRIFTPMSEMPFAGHPTLGCAIFLAEAKFKPGCNFETEIRLEENAGLVPVKVTRIGEAIHGTFTAPVVPVASTVRPPTVEVAAKSVDLDPAEIGFGEHRPGIFSGGPTFIYLPIASRAALARARPMEPYWSATISAAGPGVDCAYLYTPGGDHSETSFRSRMFAPAAGIPEDPATGAATAILAGQLMASQRFGDGTHRFRLEQGYEMGRPSDLTMEMDVSNGRLTAARVGGSAVRVAKGTIEI
jgi:trans-2,3-dihydro-3-hydroxyanthranilate isomerase